MYIHVRNPARVCLIATVTVGLLTGCVPASEMGARDATGTNPVTASLASIDLSNPLRQLESQYDARIGVRAFDTGTGQTVSYRGDERFGYASSLKVFVAAGFLSIVPAAERGQIMTWTQEDVVAAGHSPVTTEHTGDGLTLSQLAEAAVRSSDNTATNIILETIGGPARLQDVLRQAGDDSSQLADSEPELNIVEPDSTDNTTTPAAFAAGLEAFLTGSALTASDRVTLLDWMSDNPTGDPLIRAGAPEGWVVADRSGGAVGMRNDVAIVTPPGREPIILTILTVKNVSGAEYENATVADTSRLVLDALK